MKNNIKNIWIILFALFIGFKPLFGTNRLIETHLDITAEELNALIKTEISGLSYYWEADESFSIEISISEPWIIFTNNPDEISVHCSISLNLESSLYPTLIEILENEINASPYSELSFSVGIPSLNTDVEELSLQFSGTMQAIEEYCDFLPQVMSEINSITQLELDVILIDDICTFLNDNFEELNITFDLDNSMAELNEFVPNNIMMTIIDVDISTHIIENAFRISLGVETETSNPVFTTEIRLINGWYEIKIQSTIATSIIKTTGGFIETNGSTVELPGLVGQEIEQNEFEIFFINSYSNSYQFFSSTFYYQGPWGWFSREYHKNVSDIGTEWDELDIVHQIN